jgi:hypothetical protein
MHIHNPNAIKHLRMPPASSGRPVGRSDAPDALVSIMRLEDLRGRIFLDTCVGNLILDFGEQIHEGAPIPHGVNERTARDVEALSITSSLSGKELAGASVDRVSARGHYARSATPAVRASSNTLGTPPPSSLTCNSTYRAALDTAR